LAVVASSRHGAVTLARAAPAVLPAKDAAGVIPVPAHTAGTGRTAAVAAGRGGRRTAKRAIIRPRRQCADDSVAKAVNRLIRTDRIVIADRAMLPAGEDAALSW